MFEETIQKLKKDDYFSQDLQEILQSSGLNVRFANIQFSQNGFIFALLPNKKMQFCFAYLDVISHKDFKEIGAPILHFCQCVDLQKNLQNPHLIFKHKNINSFEFSIWQGRSATGIFTDYELKICPNCLNILSNILNNFSESKQYEIFENLKSQMHEVDFKKNTNFPESSILDFENLDSENAQQDFEASAIFSRQDLQNLIFSQAFVKILRDDLTNFRI